MLILTAVNFHLLYKNKWLVCTRIRMKIRISIGQDMGLIFKKMAEMLGGTSQHWRDACAKNISQMISVVDPWHFGGSGCGSGSSDPYLCPTDPEADPGGPKTYGSGYRKSHKDVCHKTVDLEIKVFSYCFCLMIEGSGAGFVLVTDGGSGCGSGRSKNIRILRMHNTANYSWRQYSNLPSCDLFILGVWVFIITYCLQRKEWCFPCS